MRHFPTVPSVDRRFQDSTDRRCADRRFEVWITLPGSAQDSVVSELWIINSKRYAIASRAISRRSACAFLEHANRRHGILDYNKRIYQLVIGAAAFADNSPAPYVGPLINNVIEAHWKNFNLNNPLVSIESSDGRMGRGEDHPPRFFEQTFFAEQARQDRETRYSETLDGRWPVAILLHMPRSSSGDQAGLFRREPLTNVWLGHGWMRTCKGTTSHYADFHQVASFKESTQGTW